jgi:hypothetical protein
MDMIGAAGDCWGGGASGCRAGVLFESAHVLYGVFADECQTQSLKRVAYIKQPQRKVSATIPERQTLAAAPATAESVLSDHSECERRRTGKEDICLEKHDMEG